MTVNRGARGRPSPWLAGIALLLALVLAANLAINLREQSPTGPPASGDAPPPPRPDRP